MTARHHHDEHHTADAEDPRQAVPSHWRSGGPIPLASDITGQRGIDERGNLEPSSTYPTLEALHDALNRFDPHFYYDFAVATIQPGALPPVPITRGLVASATRATDDRAITFHIFAKYAQATEDRPVPGSFTPAFAPDTPEADAWDDFLRFGLPIDQLAVTELNIDLPGGLGATAAEGFVRVGPSRSELARPFDLLMTIRAPDDSVVAETVVHMEPATTGIDGKGFAASGIAHGDAFDLTLKIRLDVDKFNLTLGERDLTGRSPADVLPAVRVLAALKPENQIAFSMAGQLMMAPAQIPEAMFADDEAVNVLTACEALATIQRHAVTSVTMPDLREVTVNEACTWLEAVRLLNGEMIEGTWNALDLTLTADAQLAPLDEPHMVEFDSPYVLVVGDQHVALGTRHVQLAAARMVSCDLEAGTARLEPAGSDRVTTSLTPR